MRSTLRPGPDPFGVFGLGYDEEGEGGYEITGGSQLSVRELLDPRIDVHAQRALRRMSQGGPATRAAALGMYRAVKTGRLGGIYIENQLVPAQRARRLGTWWWKVIPRGEDSAVVLEPKTAGAAPIIVFRDGIRSQPARLDAALLKAWARVHGLTAGTIGFCPASPSGGTVMAEVDVLRKAGPILQDIIPKVFCSVPDLCREPVRKVASHAAYVDLLRAADAALVKCGRTSLEDRLHMLSGIYYGTPWSRDFDVEKSTVRNAAFQGFLARTYGNADDPRSCLGCGLFLSLKRSQDVAGVDMGHVLIGLNARMRFASREVSVPSTSSTGLDITTWVGDLAGASARVALDRVKAPKTSATRYFGGTDYGATSNLEGDLGAFLLAGGSGGIAAPLIPAGGSVADPFKRFFVDGIGRKDRCRQFLLLQGATVYRAPS